MSHLEEPDEMWKRRFRRRLFAWYRRHARDLPWRGTTDPYRVWVSEVMLQQTQVATVIPYYHRFLEAFPTVQALAAAPESHVLRLWEGLGYYRRARQLHRAAQRVVGEFGGRFPTDLQAARSLPGIGRYTAGAILSIAMGSRLPILEANTIRLFSRLLALREDPAGAVAQRLLWQFAASILPGKNVGDFNQALMELGSLVCTPREPACPSCPVMAICPTHAGGLQAEIPKPKLQREVERVTEACLVIRRGQHLLLRQCAVGERWAGLWDFPRISFGDRPFEGGASSSRDISAALAHGVRELTGLTVTPGRHLTTIKHGVTRFRITLICYEARYRRGPVSGKPLAWTLPEQLPDYPLSVTGRKIACLCGAPAGPNDAA